MDEQYTVVTRKGQITIPAKIRRALGLSIGDRVSISLDEEGGLEAHLRPVGSVAEQTFGALRSSRQSVAPGDIRQTVRDHASARDERTRRG